MSQQGKLLRALQEGEFERVGDDTTIKVDVRIVAATNRDLTEEIRARRFREDLFYRVSVFPIEVPPLRERLDDIAPLATHFLERICTELGRDPLSITRAQLSTLKRQEWRGNIRELKNVIERAVISSTGNRLRLHLALPGAVAREVPVEDRSPEDAAGFLTAAEFKELERGNLRAALAELLGLKPSTLAYRMKTLGIARPGS